MAPNASYTITVKWGKQIFKEVVVDTCETPEVFKSQLWTLTGIPPHRQTIIGLKGGKLRDDSQWSATGIRDNMTLMLMGTPDKSVLPPPPKNRHVRDDLDATADDPMYEPPSVGPPGLTNLGNTCYMNSSVQCLKAVPPLVEALQSYRGSTTAVNPAERLSASLRDVISRLRSGNSASINPVAFLAVLRQVYPQFGERGRDGMYMQQDAEECWGEILSRLASAMKTNEGNKVDQIFSIETVAVDTCEEGDPPETVSRSENVRALKCHISQSVNHLSQGIREGLEETIEKRSDALDKSAKWKRSSRLQKIPPFLIVQFVRFYWKPVENVKAKILRNVSFPVELDVFEFCTDELRAKLSAKRDEISAAGEVGDAKTGEKSTATAASASSAAAPEKMDTGGSGDDIETVYAAETGNYELCAVLTHQGRATDAGHYVAWVKDKGTRWFKFDDDKVSVHGEEDVKKLSGGGDWHMAYMCLYRAKNTM